MAREGIKNFMDVYVMGGLRIWFKYVMFLSAYSPLFIILILKLASHYFSTEKMEIIINESVYPIMLQKPADGMLLLLMILLMAIIIISNILLWLYIKSIGKTRNALEVKVNSVKEMNYIYIGYIMTYVIPFLSLGYGNIFDLISLLILLIIVCIIYVNSNLLYVNVIFNLFGYNLFKVEDEKSKVYYILTKRNQIYIDEKIITSPISDISEKFLLDIR